MKAENEKAEFTARLSTGKSQPEYIQSYGDSLEQHFADRILNVLPSYAVIWATYIGNNGSAQAFAMSKPDELAEQNRAKFWEHSYTLFESLALCWKIQEELEQREKITSCLDYMWNLNAWIAFYAHLGRIYDMTKDISEQLDEQNITQPIYGFFDSRCIVLHGSKVPMKWVDNVLSVPPLGERPGCWHDKMPWNELSSDQFNFITSQVGKTLGELEPLLNNFFSRVFGLLEKRLNLSPVSWPSALKFHLDSNEIEITASGNGVHSSGTLPECSGSSQLFNGGSYSALE